MRRGTGAHAGAEGEVEGLEFGGEGGGGEGVDAVVGEFGAEGAVHEFEFATQPRELVQRRVVHARTCARLAVQLLNEPFSLR